MEEPPESIEPAAGEDVNLPATINVAGSTPELVADSQSDDLKIVMGEFEGPLDLISAELRR